MHIGKFIQDGRGEISMNMTPGQFWQNFELGKEVEIACGFLYDVNRPGLGGGLLDCLKLWLQVVYKSLGGR